MTQTLFFAWLHRLEKYVARTPGRNILLLIYNFAAHGGPDTVQTLSNFRIEFLPPLKTSNAEPLDARIISWIKSKYCRILLSREFYDIDAGKKSVYNLYILT